MSTIQETFVNLLLNLLPQIGFFAIVTAAFSPLVGRAKAKHQSLFYCVVLLICLGVPVVNTFWHSSAPIAAEKPQQFPSRAGQVASHLLWSWQSDAEDHKPLTIAPALQKWISSVWAVFVLLQLARFILAMYRIHQLREGAFELSPAQARMSHRVIKPESRVSVLQSTAIDDPATIGVFHPVILLPSKVLPNLGKEEISAVVAHEYGHVRRGDFAIHMMCEFLSLPVAWHPGVAYLRSKILQTRELACDEYAATFVGNRRSYASTLLRLASLCLHVPRSETAGVGFFDGDNLEARITTLTGKTRLLSRTGVIGLALATSITFSAGTVVAHAMSFQTSAEPSKTADKFVGTWHWMFEGRSFVTMVLVRDHGRLTGTVTGSRIALNADGELSRADPSEDLTPKPITKAIGEGSGLHITVMDSNEPFEFVMTLKDATHAEIRPKKTPSNMKPLAAEKVL